MPHRIAAGLMLLFVMVLAGDAFACQYAVRDVGFVSLTDQPYRVVVVFPQETERGRVEEAESQATAILHDVHVNLKVGRVGDGDIFDDAAALAGQQLPAAVLTDPSGRLAVIDTQWASSLQAVLEPLVRSPAREGLASELIGGFATVLLVEGTDPEQNAQAVATAQATIKRINANLSQFDRVLEVGPTLRVIKSTDRPQERWLLWALGIASDSGEQPELAILFGQGRRLGPILQGESLNQTTLYAHLAIVVQDCECDLDRAWLYGQRFVLPWTDRDRKHAYEALGFDPENALVRAEVARILERGSSSGKVTSPDPYVHGDDIGGLGLKIYDIEPDAVISEPEHSKIAAATEPVINPTGTTAVSPVSRPATLADTEKTAGPSVVIVSLVVAVLLVLSGAVLMVLRTRGGGA